MVLNIPEKRSLLNGKEHIDKEDNEKLISKEEEKKNPPFSSDIQQNVDLQKGGADDNSKAHHKIPLRPDLANQTSNRSINLLK